MPTPTIPGYEILGELGHGGMGVVYQARQSSLGRVVALKMIRAGDLASPDDLARFKSEAEAVARLKHPNIVQIYEVGECDGRPYFSLEYVEGGNLAQKVNGVPQPPRPAAQLVEVLARAVHAAHQCGIVHRDLKPANILLQVEYSKFHIETREYPTPAKSVICDLESVIPKITDFGLAKRLDSEAGQTLTGAVVGTLSYMAPEQAAGKTKEVGPAADIYSLGAILYQLLTGRPPFLADSWEATREMVLFQEPVPPRRLQPKLPRDLQTICLKCLNKDPHQRYISVLDLADELRRYLDDKPIQSRPVGSVERLWRWARRKPALAGLAALATLTVAAGILIFVGFTLFQSRLSREKQINQAMDALDQGIGLCEKGEGAEGLLWLARSLELAPPDNDDLQWLIRGNLAGWGPQVNKLEAILPHQSEVRAVAFSPDGKCIVTGCVDGTAHVWDTTTATPKGPPLKHPNQVLAVAFSSDGKSIVTGCMDHVGRLWDALTSQIIREFPHEERVVAVAYSREGMVLTGSWDHTAQLWKAATGDRIGQPLQHQDMVQAVAFSPDGKTALTGSRDGIVKFWDAVTGADLNCSLSHNKNPIKSVAISPDGETIVTGSLHRVSLWNMRDGSPIGQPVPIKGDFACVAFSRQGPTVLTRWRENSIRLLELTSAQPVGAAFSHEAEVNSATFSPDGNMVLTGSRDKTARLWRISPEQSPKLLLRHKKAVQDVTFRYDSKAVVTGSLDATAQVWETARGEAVGAPLQHKDSVVAVAFSPDGETVLTGSWDNTAQRWCAASGKPLDPPLRHEDKVCAVAFSPDGTTVLTGSRDTTAQLWNSDTGERRGTLPHDDSVLAVAFSPNGRYALTGTEDGTAQLWDASSGIAIGMPLKHQWAVHAVACNGDVVLTGSEDGTARLWDLGTGKSLALQHQGIVHDGAFSADGLRALTASWDTTAQVWKTATGERQGAALHHDGIVLSAAFSPHGRLVVTGSSDQSARLWDAVSGKPFGPRLRHGGLVRKVAFSPDNKLVATASADHFGRIWEVPHPMQGTVQQLVLWVQVITGMELNDSGAVRLLDAGNWDRAGKRLHQFGGRPMHQ